MMHVAFVLGALVTACGEADCQINNQSCDGENPIHTLSILQTDRTRYEAVHYVQTNLSSDGGGKSEYIDRHDIRCGHNQALSQWRLRRKGSPSNNIQFRYTCVDAAPPFGSCSEQATSWNDRGGGNTVYFDRHNLRCATNTALTQWKLDRVGDSIRFKYTCCQATAGLDACSTTTTPPNDDGRGSSINFDRHNVLCPSNKVITQWRLLRPTHHQISFQFTCCVVRDTRTDDDGRRRTTTDDDGRRRTTTDDDGR
eukprot:TRINITY_DN87_c0_g1_i17.p1 TRINITY_DN87_c0_g1~~TRINITY_DN87_c0_g1_i17.p1  ORF type:complete len:282 (-),score=12.94 TRINITY_DN87_c0_g1_i17:70-831(-)